MVEQTRTLWDGFKRRRPELIHTDTNQDLRKEARQNSQAIIKEMRRIAQYHEENIYKAIKEEDVETQKNKSQHPI